MSITFITDFSYNSGLGNFIRSRELFEKAKLYYKSYFIVLSKNKKKIIKSDLILIDLPGKDYNIKKIKHNYLKPNGKVIGLDYNFKEKIDVNISLLNKNKYAIKNYLSLNYAIIRTNFFALDKKKDGSCVICIGSSDIKKKSLNLKKKISKDFDNIKYIIMKKKFNILKNKFLNDINIYKLFSNCSFALVNGGTTMLEMIYLKKYVITFPQTCLERKFAHKLKKNGAIMSINNVPKKEDILAKIKKRKKKIIDGQGVDRIIKIISKYNRY